MSSKVRDIVIFVLGLALVAGAAAGGYAAVSARANGAPPVRQVLAEVTVPTPSATHTAAPQYERWTVGIARRPVTVRTRPAGDAHVLANLGTHTVAGFPTLLLVDSVRQVDGVPWYKVWVPVPPNETRGWVRDGQLAFFTTVSKIVIDLSQRQLMVYRRGSLQATFPVAVGRPGLATPTGTYFVTMKLKQSDPSGPYGVLALGTSAFQPKLSSWPGGGVVGIHGTNEPRLIGKAVSHGCVRMKNADILKVSSLVPAGSPIIIQK